jgi:hypothetical protein
MSSCFTIGVPNFLYSLGILEKQVTSIKFIQISEDNQRAGERPFVFTQQLLLEISKILRVPFEYYSIDELIAGKIKWEKGDLVDCQIFYMYPNKKIQKSISILALQPEYVNFKRPSIFRGYSPSFRKRIDISIKLLIPFRMFKYYGLALKPKPNGFIRELSIDHYQVQKYRKEIFEGLAKNENFSLLAALRDQNIGKKVCIIFPFAKHWGGSTDELNEKLFILALDEYSKGGFDKLVIKNHPSDPQEYSQILPIELQNINPTIITKVSDRAIPIELIVEAFDSYRLIGAESTAFMTLSPFVSDITIIVDSELLISKKSQKYQSGETRGQYESKVIRI